MTPPGSASAGILVMVALHLRRADWLNEVVTVPISFLPHFIAMPAVVGMLFLILSPSTP